MTNDLESLSDTVGRRVWELRRGRNWTAAQLAEACAKAGHPELTEQTIYNIESGRRVEGRRRRHVTVDELWAFAKAFDLPPAVLLGYTGADETDAAWQATQAELTDLLRHLERTTTRLRESGRIPPPKRQEDE